MKKSLLVFFLSLLYFQSYSQIQYEEGYIIDNSGKRTPALIKNVDWKNNPTSLEYMLSEGAASKIGGLEDIQEFGVGHLKYSRFSVKIDRSAENLKDLSKDKQPEFKEETLFLKSLLEGRANLYLYEQGELKRYFYSVDGGEVKQLVYKSYRFSDERIGKNESYKQQLWLDMMCKDITANYAQSVSYQKKELIRYFVKYNKCENAEYQTFEEKVSRDRFNLSIRPGVSQTSFWINRYSSPNIDFGKVITYRLGLEAEFILPYNKNKWAIVVEPTFHSFQAEAKDGRNYYGTDYEYSIDYKAIELPIGIRHYFYISPSSKIFLTGAFAKDFSLTPSVKAVHLDRDAFEISPRYHINLGLGYTFKNKFSLDLKHGLKRGLLIGSNNYSSGYRLTSLVFGYNLF